MSWSLQITEEGDFNVEASRYSTVTGQQKLVQDFRCALLEPMGTDNLHPEFGSLIDGGITPEGVVSNGVIGETDLDLITLFIQTEVNRIARLMQQSQLARAKADKLTYGKATLTPQEVLLSLNGIQFTQSQDTLFAVISLTSANNANFSINLPVNTNPSLATS